jgi:hypothetical protein
MSYSATALKVMIATPSDVAPERNAVRQVLTDWNSAHSEARKIVLMPVGWDTHSSPQMGGRPQALINEQVLEGSDILVAVFWTKAGTPTGEHASGTIEEIEEYLKGNHHAMIYFSDAPVVLGSIDMSQYEELKKFKESCKSRGLYASYSDLNEFSKNFSHHLQLTLNKQDFRSNDGETVSGEVPPRPSVKLTADAQALIKGAALGEGQIMNLRHLGGAVIGSSGGNLVADGHPRSLARWEGAIDELERNGLVTPNGSRTMFRLNSDGYLVADGLAD